jgi:hypothetical protein
VALWPNPYEPRGFYPTEQWGDDHVAWTQPGEASLYVVARQHPLVLRMYPAGEVGEALQATLAVDGRVAAVVPMTAREWHRVELPQVPFQHAAIITIGSPHVWAEPGPGGRLLSIAVVMEP